MRTSFADPLARLRQLDLITDSQRRSLETHPHYAELAALDDPVRQLLWMHAHKIVSEDDLDDMMSFEEHPSERDVLYDLIQFDIMSDEEFQAVRKHVRTESSSSGGLRRLQVVEEVHRHIASATSRRRWKTIREMAYAVPMLVLTLVLLFGPVAYALHALWTSLRR